MSIYLTIHGQANRFRSRLGGNPKGHTSKIRRWIPLGLCLLCMLLCGCWRFSGGTNNDGSTVNCLDLLGKYEVGATLRYKITSEGQTPSVLILRLDSLKNNKDFRIFKYTVITDSGPEGHEISLMASKKGEMFLAETSPRKNPQLNPVLLLPESEFVETGQALFKSNPFLGMRWEAPAEDGHGIIHRVTRIWEAPEGNKHVAVTLKDGRHEWSYEFSTSRGFESQELYRLGKEGRKHLLRRMVLDYNK